MTKQIVLMILVLSCLSFYSKGQDKVFLINGNKLVGIMNPTMSTDTTLYLSIFDKGIHIPYNIVRAASFSRATRKGGADLMRDKIFPEFESGLYHRAGIGIMMGSHSYWDDVDASLYLSTIIGYKWNNLKNLGLKVGVDVYEDYLSIPFALHYELELKSRLSSPLVYSGVGYGIVWARSGAEVPFDKIRGGLHHYFGVGYRTRMEKGNIIFRIGGQSQRVIQRISEPDLPQNYYSVIYQKRFMRRFTLGVDITF